MPEFFGSMPDGRQVHRFRLDSGLIRVAVLEIGAAVQSIEAPARDGTYANVVLGMETLEDYRLRSPHFGAVPGRTAGRIAGGRFTLDGETYTLPQNDGANTLHGGPDGFGRQAWSAVDHGASHVTLRLISPDGAAGYPGEVDVTLRYTVAGQALQLDYRATTSRPTLLNLTNHSYFNLRGEGSGDIGDHRLTIGADQFLPIRPDGIPTGEVRRVGGTVFDFRQPRMIGERLRVSDAQIIAARGYDQPYVLNGSGLREVASLEHANGRRLVLSTTEPALQLYTGNSLTGALHGPSGRAYRQTDGVCLEAQHPPDSIHHPHLPQSVLRPGETYEATTIFRFETIP